MSLCWLIITTAGLSTGILAQPGSAPAAPPAQSAPAVDDAFTRRMEAVDAAMAKIVDLRADFEQRRHTPLLKKPLVSKGTLVTRGNAVRWNTASPRASVMAVSAGEVRLYYPDDKLVEVYPVNEGFRDIAGAPLPRLATLRDRFEIAPLPLKEIDAEEGNADLFAVTLTPRSEELRKRINSVRVLIDQRIGAATRVDITDADGERTEIHFSAIKINSGVKEGEVALKVPEGVRTTHPLGTPAAPKEKEP